VTGSLNGGDGGGIVPPGVSAPAGPAEFSQSRIYGPVALDWRFRVEDTGLFSGIKQRAVLAG